MKRYFIASLIILASSFIAFAQKPVTYEVYALKYGELAHPVPISQLVLNGPDKDSVEMFFTFWLIKGSNGKNILVDAGCACDMPAAIDFGLTKCTRPDSVLMETGLKPIDITDIIITHPHWDHVDGVNLFPNAQIWIQKEDYNYYVSAAWQKDGNHGGIVKGDILYLVDRNFAGKLTLVDGDNKEIFPGIKVYTGSRHTYNSQYVGVQSGADKIIIASDNIWVYYALDHMLPAPSYGTFDAAGYVAAMKRMKTLVSKPDFIIPGHDAKLFTKFPKITGRVIKIL